MESSAHISTSGAHLRAARDELEVKPKSSFIPTIIDMLVCIFLLILWIIFSRDSATGPNVRGFFKNDKDIGFPVGPTTVSTVWLAIMAALIPILTLIVYNLYFFFKSDTGRRHLWTLLYQFLVFSFAILGNDVVTNALKLMVGRLRPDFISRCKPDYNRVYVDPNTGWVADTAVCTGDPAMILEGRKSFPSGHASNIMCGMVFLSIWLARAFPLNVSTSLLLRPLLQLTCITTGLVVGASRVWDNVHNPSDVIIGSIIGTCFGIVPFYLSKFFNPEYFPTAEKVSPSSSSSSGAVADSRAFSQSINDYRTPLDIGIVPSPNPIQTV